MFLWFSVYYVRTILQPQTVSQIVCVCVCVCVWFLQTSHRNSDTAVPDQWLASRNWTS